MVCTAAVAAIKTVDFDTACQIFEESGQPIDVADGLRLHAEQYIDETLATSAVEPSTS